MSKRSLALLVAVVLVVGGSLWLGRDEASRGVDAVLPPVVDASAPEPARVKAIAAIDPPPAQATEAPSTSRERVAAERVAVERVGLERVPAPDELDSETFALVGARWVDVKVLLPSGMPPDDAPALLALGWDDDEVADWELRIAASEVDLAFPPLEGNGWSSAARRAVTSATIRVPFAPSARYGALILQSRYAHAEPLRIALASAGESSHRIERVSLRAELGAWVTGRLVLPDGAQERGFTPESASLSLAKRPGLGVQRHDSREIRVAQDLSFALRAISARSSYTLEATFEGLVGYTRKDVRCEPGEHVELEVPLRLGGTVSGRVLGEDGTHVGGAWVSVAETTHWMPDDGHIGIETSRDGTYRVVAVPEGGAHLSVRAEGWLRRDDVEVSVRDGEELIGLDIVLERGGTIAGRVIWPDGRPAVGATVETSVERMGFFGDRTLRTKADVDGRFAFTGLAGGPFPVIASAAPETDERGGQAGAEQGRIIGFFDSIAIRDPSRPEGAWTALAESVAIDSLDLVLELEGPLTVEGRVVDDLGAPVRSFRISAGPAPSENGAVFGSFGDSDGSFQLRGFRRGEWWFAAEADDHASGAEPLVVSLPAAELVTVVLVRGARIAGVVLAPDGTPVRGASVVLAGNRQSPRPAMYPPMSKGEARTDELGRFALEGVAAAGRSLVARHPDWAPSEALVVDAPPAGSIEGVVLVLRVGATITGEVFDDQGRPAVGCLIGVGHPGQGSAFGRGGGVETDEAGHFTLERVAPGTVVISAVPDLESMLESFVGGTEAQARSITSFAQERTATVEARDGEMVHVVLGAAAK